MAGAQTHTGQVRDLRHKTTGAQLFRGHSYPASNTLALLFAKMAQNGGQYEDPPQAQPQAKAKTRAEPLANAGKTAPKQDLTQPLQSSGGKVKRSRADGAKSVRAKSVLSNNPQDDKLG